MAGKKGLRKGAFSNANITAFAIGLGVILATLLLAAWPGAPNIELPFGWQEQSIKYVSCDDAADAGPGESCYVLCPQVVGYQVRGEGFPFIVNFDPCDDRFGRVNTWAAPLNLLVPVIFGTVAAVVAGIWQQRRR